MIFLLKVGTFIFPERPAPTVMSLNDAYKVAWRIASAYLNRKLTRDNAIADFEADKSVTSLPRKHKAVAMVTLETLLRRADFPDSIEPDGAPSSYLRPLSTAPIPPIIPLIKVPTAEGFSSVPINSRLARSVVLADAKNAISWSASVTYF